MLSKVRTDGDPGEPLLADGVIYVGDRAETMYAISIADGAVLWRKAAVGFAFSPRAARRHDLRRFGAWLDSALREPTERRSGTAHLMEMRPNRPL